MTRRDKGPRRPRWSPERPLRLEATVPTTREAPNPRAGLAAPLRALAALVPAARDGADGRTRRAAWKLALGAVAVWMASLARDDWRWAVPSLAVIGLAVALPVRETRRARWLRAADRLERPQAVWGHAPAEVTYDGTKLVVRAEGRQFSVRPAQARVVAGADGAGPWLAFIPGAGAKTAIGFALLSPTGSTAPEVPCPAPRERTVTVDADGWDTLLATFPAA